MYGTYIRVYSDTIVNKDAEVVYYSPFGTIENLGIKTIPFYHYNPIGYGTYQLYFPEYNLTCYLNINQPTPTPTPTFTLTPTPTFTLTPTPTSSPTPIPTTPPPTQRPTNNPTPTVTNSPTPSPTLSPTPSPTLLSSPTSTPTVTNTPTPTVFYESTSINVRYESCINDLGVKYGRFVFELSNPLNDGFLIDESSQLFDRLLVYDQFNNLEAGPTYPIYFPPNVTTVYSNVGVSARFAPYGSVIFTSFGASYNGIDLTKNDSFALPNGQYVNWLSDFNTPLFGITFNSIDNYCEFPLPTPGPTPGPTPTVTPTRTSTPTPTVTNSPTPSPTLTNTPTPTPSPTSLIPSSTPSPTYNSNCWCYNINFASPPPPEGATSTVYYENCEQGFVTENLPVYNPADSFLPPSLMKICVKHILDSFGNEIPVIFVNPSSYRSYYTFTKTNNNCNSTFDSCRPAPTPTPTFIFGDIPCSRVNFFGFFGQEYPIFRFKSISGVLLEQSFDENGEILTIDFTFEPILLSGFGSYQYIEDVPCPPTPTPTPTPVPTTAFLNCNCKIHVYNFIFGGNLEFYNCLSNIGESLYIEPDSGPVSFCARPGTVSADHFIPSGGLTVTNTNCQGSYTPSPGFGDPC